jgi:hypothetical protein
MKGYPRGFRRTLLGVVGWVFLSGLVLAPGTLDVHTGLALPWRLAANGRTACAALHAAGAFALVSLAGALWSVHMRSGWRRGRQRVSGVMLGVAIGVLVITTIVIYYVGDEAVGRAAALVHVAAGVAAAVPFCWHWRRGSTAQATTCDRHALR